MKVIFLDIDGVLNSIEDWIEQSRFGHPHNSGSNVISRTKLGLLALLLRSTDAKIVISSTWRIHYTPAQMREFFLDRVGEKGEEFFEKDVFVGRTGHRFSSGYMDRWMEVREYLEGHPEITEFVILDDVNAGFSDTEELKDHFVKTNPDTGITVLEIEKAIDILKGDKSHLPRWYS